MSSRALEVSGHRIASSVNLNDAMNQPCLKLLLAAEATLYHFLGRIVASRLFANLPAAFDIAGPAAQCIETAGTTVAMPAMGTWIRVDGILDMRFAT